MSEGIKFGLSIRDHYIFSVLASLILILLGFLVVRRKEAGTPKGLQNAGELVIEFLAKQVETEFGPERVSVVVPFLGALFLSILVSNWLGLIPQSLAPTTDLSTTAGLGVSAVLGFQIINFVANGRAKAMKQLFKPAIFLFPLKIIDNFARVLSLSLRLFGNMFGEHVVAEIVSAIIPLFLPIILLLLGALVGLIQAFVFTILSMKYLAEEIGVAKEH